MKAAKDPDRQTRGVRYTQAEWDQVKKAAKAKGLGIGDYVRSQTLPPVPPSPPRADCPHGVVLVVGGAPVAYLELCQCAECGLLGMAEPGKPVRWAS